MLRKTIFIIGVLISILTSKGQEPGVLLPTSNLHSKIAFAVKDSLFLDSLAIVPKSIQVVHMPTGMSYSTSDYSYNVHNGFLYFKSPTDSIRIIYRTFPISFLRSYQNKKPENFIRKDTGDIWYNFYQPGIEQSTFLDFDGLQYSGNFSRDVSFGSNQDLVVNSAFNLQLSGRLSNGIEILAALTDNNIPIQPDGNTQQLQNFDKVFIQVSKDRHRLIAGDYVLASPKSYFLKFNKQLQGISYNGGYTFQKEQLDINGSASFAVAKGKFTRNTLNGQENNQGPYRLVGNNGEVFLIILAGSEKVYVDGILLNRGEEADYIIDYNTAEIRFTPNFLITKDSRIVIDFEYADRNYFRSLFHTGTFGTWKKWQFNMDFYTEQDSKNKPILQDISDSTINFLETIGNNTNEAFISGVNETDFSRNATLYLLKDTLVDGILYDSVFVYTTDSIDVLYNLSFTYLGNGKGNYNPTKNANNQRVYAWSAPINGIPTGSYEPVILIITPKKDQFLTAGVIFNTGKDWKLQADVGMSNRDFNTFSKINNPENIGFSGHMAVFHNYLSKKDSSYRIQSNIQYEVKGARFSPLEPYRPVEFTRDWSLQNQQQKLTEHIIIAKSQLNTHKNIGIGYEFGTMLREKDYSGFKHKISVQYIRHGWNFKGNLNILNARDSLTKSTFLRPDVYLSKYIPIVKGVTAGFAFFQERNAINAIQTDSLNASSFFNNNTRFFVQNGDSGFIQISIDYRWRNDLFPVATDFKVANQSHTLDMRGKFLQLKNQDLSWAFTLRNLQIKDSTLVVLPPEKTYLGRGEYGIRVKKGFFRMNILYELGSGQERVREFSFVEVLTGQGVYNWLDENEDGIQQQNEFVIAAFQDSAKYIKVFTTLNEYIKARQVTYNQVLTLTPKVLWFEAKGIKGFLSKFQFQSFLETKRKSLENAKNSPFNPFIFKSDDTSIISLNLASRNNILLNPGSSTFSMSYSFQTNQDKTLLVNGFDTRKKLTHTINTRIGLGNSFSGNIDLFRGNEVYNSEFFIQNNYNIQSFKTEPKLIYNYKSSLRISTSYAWILKINSVELGGEKNNSHQLNLDMRYVKSGKQSLEAKFTFAQVKFTGNSGTTRSYILLEGLQPGKNYLWNLSYDRTISKNLQLNLGYEGRKTGAAKVVNTGKASIRALF